MRNSGVAAKETSSSGSQPQAPFVHLVNVVQAADSTTWG